MIVRTSSYNYLCRLEKHLYPMHNRLLISLSLCFILFWMNSNFSYSSTQQSGKTIITGRIIDAQKNPVYPVAVMIEGTTTGEYTNENGEYTISGVPSGNHVIVVSGIGVNTSKTPVSILSGRVNRIADIIVDNSIELNEVAVIGKSEARRQQEQAYAISVLDIQQAYNNTAPLNKLLNNVSSVRIREDGGVGSNYNFSLNGFSGNQVKFFLDGIPMDNFGSSFNLGNISVNMAERVEVYKGVLPVSLGADALGGAVNIISRKDANYLDASYSFGSFNTHRASVNGAFTDVNSGFTIRANAFYNYSDNNYKVYVPVNDLNTGKEIEKRWVKRFNDDYQSGGLKLETGITNKPYADYLLAGIILSKNDKDIQTGATMEKVYGGIKSKSESVIPSIRYKKDDLFIEGLSLSLHGAYSMVNSFNTDTLSRAYNWLGEWIETGSKGERSYTDSKIRNKEWLGNGNISYMIDNYQSLTLNHMISSVNRKMYDKAHPDDETNNIPQKLTKNITGLGWQIKYDRWNANVFGKLYGTKSSTYKRVDEYTENARLERVEDSKTNLGYGAAGTYYIIPVLQAKVSYEQAYRLPEGIEMFGDGLIQQRNPDLKPESSDNINIGLLYDQRLSKHHLFAEANFIYRSTKDFILKEVSLTSNPTTGYDNIGKVLTRGFEAGVKYKWNNMINLGVSMTYQHITDNQEFEENKNSLVGEGITENIRYKSRLPNIPYLFGNGDLGFRFQNIGFDHTELSLDYSLSYIHEYYLSFPGLGSKGSKKIIPEQFSHDIALGYTMGNGKYSVVAECTNLTDAKLYDNYMLQKPGRAFNVKFRFFLK